jgi:hypothetical protein
MRRFHSLAALKSNAEFFRSMGEQPGGDGVLWWQEHEGTMSLRLSDADAAILIALADYHVLTLAQLAIAVDRNSNSLRRRLRALADQGMINVLARRRPAFQGRPEHMVLLCEPGFDLLRACGRVPRSAAWERDSVRRAQHTEHELLINDLRIQLVQIQRFLPAVVVRCFVQNPLCPGEHPDSVDSIHEKFQLDATGEQIEFTPDGVFSLTHRELEKTLLFFLEADRATEPLTSARGGRGLSAKLAAYQAYLSSDRYRRYEDILRAKLRGFRLLLLVDGAARFAAVCRLVRETPQSEFVWVTSREQLLHGGCWGPVWTVGGRITDPSQSILGTKMPVPCPTPPELARHSQVVANVSTESSPSPAEG